jgi:sec-independent protein translocase protein TatA
MFGIGPVEVIGFCLVVLLLFGNRLPGVMRSLGQGISEFRSALRSPDDADRAGS